jgi:hypothetical protein
MGLDNTVTLMSLWIQEELNNRQPGKVAVRRLTVAGHLVRNTPK